MARIALLLSGVLTAAAGAARAEPGDPPHFSVPATAGVPLTFLAYGDTRFTERDGVANPEARRALVHRMAAEKPAAIFIGGDLVYQGSDPADYDIYRHETAEWTELQIPVYPTLGNHELRGCDADATPCLENWWRSFEPLRPFRWYSVTLGTSTRVLLLDSDSDLKPGSPQRLWFERQVQSAGPEVRFLIVALHYPPVRDPIFPRGRNEAEIASYFSAHARALRARVLVIGSHVHNYERFRKNGVMYLVSGGGGAKPHPVLRLFGELSHLHTAVNYHYLRFTLEGNHLDCVMVRFDSGAPASGDPWTEPDRFTLVSR